MAKMRLRIPEYGVDITTGDTNAVANLIKGLTKSWTYRGKDKEHIVPAFDPDTKIITEKVT